MKKRAVQSGVVTQFKNHLLLEEKSDNTIEKYMHDIKLFIHFIGDLEISKERVIAYKKHLQQKYKPRSVNSMLAGINSFFDFVGWSDMRVKTIKLQQQIYCPEEKELTKSEYERLCEAANAMHSERTCLILQTICGTGIRVSELQFITVEAVEKGEAIVSLKGKTRAIFLVKQLRKKLLSYAKIHHIKSGQIFITKRGKPINRSNVWREMKNLCHIANVDPQKVFPHNLRHLFARVFYNMDKDIAKLADILGHSSINTTRIYIISTGMEHRRRMENMRLIL